ncbi:hypothetical protein R5W24_003060 [Gemmata sp. JC717]|uniref:Uncharacterized protein n=1 Tax=Gemmata algarum TaxID=2975278 RepID=A0ABU5F2X3_9BACT|nr:hypothetical protein [Gemmata algarum]MDY3553946.1 hypothetical protein [Gemmata algarum]MDY3561695.1 hypothetical protein [Gemmata algarum]
MVSESELQVVVPVGFLLAEARDISVRVDRPGEEPLPIRLRLIPAQVRVSAPSAPAPHLPARPRRADLDSDYLELGNGD